MLVEPVPFRERNLLGNEAFNAQGVVEVTKGMVAVLGCPISKLKIGTLSEVQLNEGNDPGPSHRRFGVDPEGSDEAIVPRLAPADFLDRSIEASRIDGEPLVDFVGRLGDPELGEGLKIPHGKFRAIEHSCSLRYDNTSAFGSGCGQATHALRAWVSRTPVAGILQPVPWYNAFAAVGTEE